MVVVVGRAESFKRLRELVRLLVLPCESILGESGFEDLIKQSCCRGRGEGGGNRDRAMEGEKGREVDICRF